nr:immunoglobulin heavy chain junction region [Mus musculus]
TVQEGPTIVTTRAGLLT